MAFILQAPRVLGAWGFGRTSPLVSRLQQNRSPGRPGPRPDLPDEIRVQHRQPTVPIRLVATGQSCLPAFERRKDVGPAAGRRRGAPWRVLPLVRAEDQTGLARPESDLRGRPSPQASLHPLPQPTVNPGDVLWTQPVRVRLSLSFRSSVLRRGDRTRMVRVLLASWPRRSGGPER